MNLTTGCCKEEEQDAIARSDQRSAGEGSWQELVARATTKEEVLLARRSHCASHSRQQRSSLARIIASDNIPLQHIIALANLVDGPIILPSPGRGHGLFAERDYRKGERITQYGGTVSHAATAAGDYVGYLGDGVYVDGAAGYTLAQKGRWVNESDRDRSVVNATLSRDIRASTFIASGQEIFVDYGSEYKRNY